MISASTMFDDPDRFRLSKRVLHKNIHLLFEFLQTCTILENKKLGYSSPMKREFRNTMTVPLDTKEITKDSEFTWPADGKK